MWMLTYNHLDGRAITKTNFGRMKKADPAAYAHNVRQIKASGTEFQLRDDDNELYFEGLADTDSDMMDCLDDFGSGYGCTTVWCRDPNHKGGWSPING